MNDNANDTSYYGTYEEQGDKNPLVKIIGILISLVLIVIIVFSLLRACTGKESQLEKLLLDAGKEHYTAEELMPTAVGECGTVTLNQLETESLITDPKKFSTCEQENTYVKVCKLESGKYHYTPILQCSDVVTKFGDWQKGSETSLIADKSDVRFTFSGEKYNGTVKNYYPDNKTDGKNVKEYYIAAPAEGYINKDTTGASASKWFTVTENAKTYWNNSSLSSAAPVGFPTKGTEGATLTYYALTQPAAADYRTIANATIYRSQTVTKAHSYKFTCVDANVGGYLISTTVCEQRQATTFKITIDISYTCDDRTNFSTDIDYQTNAKPVAKTTVCSAGAWTNYSETKCTASASLNCETAAGFKVADRRWTWYTSGSVRSYYPSGSATAAGEKTYYVTSPTTGAAKDTATTTTAYKFYKEKAGTYTAGSTVKEWEQITKGFVSELELITAFQNLDYKVLSLKEIENTEDVRYNTQLEYRNRK